MIKLMFHLCAVPVPALAINTVKVCLLFVFR